MNASEARRITKIGKDKELDTVVSQIKVHAEQGYEYYNCSPVYTINFEESVVPKLRALGYNVVKRSNDHKVFFNISWR